MALRFGSKVKKGGKLFFVTDVGKRTVKARRIFSDDGAVNPFGQIAPGVQSLKIADIKQVKRTTKPKGMR